MNQQKLIEQIRENRDIIYQEEFFQRLKSDSLLEFRKNIQLVQGVRPTLYLEDRVQKYYAELLECYDSKEKLFTPYLELLDRMRRSDYEGLEDKTLLNEFISWNLLVKMQDFYHYRDGGAMAYSYLKDITSKKISEIVVDGLFGDTLYNVWLNIREMLRFHNMLEEKEKILNFDKILFYQRIIRIDEMRNEDKIALYNEERNNRIDLEFYEDLRRVKDLSYQNMKKSLLRVEEHPDLYQREESDQYGVPIYELNGEDFYILLRCQNRFSSNTSVRRHCYTLISEHNMEVFDSSKFIYGYVHFDIQHILHVFEQDAYSSTHNNGASGHFVNRIMTPEQVAKSERYSEIQIVNVEQEKCGQYWAMKPDYLVVFDEIEDRHIEEAKRLGIPIVKIPTKNYLDKMWEGYNQNYDLGYQRYERIYDDYTTGSDHEEERRIRR